MQHGSCHAAASLCRAAPCGAVPCRVPCPQRGDTHPPPAAVSLARGVPLLLLLLLPGPPCRAPLTSLWPAAPSPSAAPAPPAGPAYGAGAAASPAPTVAAPATSAGVGPFPLDSVVAWCSDGGPEAACCWPDAAAPWLLPPSSTGPAHPPSKHAQTHLCYLWERQSRGGTHAHTRVCATRGKCNPREGHMHKGEIQFKREEMQSKGGIHPRGGTHAQGGCHFWCLSRRS